MVDHSKDARLLVTRALPERAMALAAERFALWCNPLDRTMSAAELTEAAQAHRAEAMIVMAMDRLDGNAIRALPDTVRVIGTYSVGHNHIDLEAARAGGVAVLNTPDVLSDTVAEMALLLMLGAARRAHEGSALIHERRWTGWTPTQLLGRSLIGARLGIFGMGRIGRSIARRAAAGFDMQVHYHNRSRLSPDDEGAAVYYASADALLSNSDFLVLAAPSTPETKRFLNAARIGRLPEGAVVVNISRGDLVDDEALIAALRRGRIAAAGLDVFDGEPNVAEGYLTLPNVFLQPHLGSATLGTRVRMAELLMAGVEAQLHGQPAANRIA
jgi:lactate dehydrogenase-like 2-hydroxyacid dehydrogenase